MGAPPGGLPEVLGSAAFKSSGLPGGTRIEDALERSPHHGRTPRRRHRLPRGGRFTYDGRVRYVMAVLGACLVAALATAGPDRRAAVPIRTPRVETPIETAGTGLAPEVMVKVRVDTQGAVSRVEVLAIRPASRFDDLFRQVTEETLAGWRYAPETWEGRPIETELEWTIQFPSRDEVTEPVGPGAVFGLKRTGPPEDFWTRVCKMNREARIKLLEESGGRALAHLDQERLREGRSSRFKVFTDAGSAEVEKKLAANLEATYDVVEDLLGPTVEPRHEDYKIIAFMYASRAAYEALKRDVPSVDWAEGFYSPAGMIAFHMEMPSNEVLISLMLHEATHAYLDRHLARPGLRFPRWLSEGFAEYVGNSEIKQGELVPGRTPKVSIYATSYGTYRRKSQAALGVEQVRQAMRKGEALTLRELVRATPDTFYGERRRLYYSMAWLFVHYLRHGDEGWADQRFPTLMLYIAEGYPAEKVLEAVYRATPDELDPGFVEYVKRF